jgi:hypothetical protein
LASIAVDNWIFIYHFAALLVQKIKTHARSSDNNNTHITASYEQPFWCHTTTNQKINSTTM